MSYKTIIPSLKNIHIYDEECYPNIWTNMLYDPNTDEWFFFEVSDRVNQIEEFRNAMRHWKFKDFTHIGFNNIGYDYPVAHAIITDKTITCAADIFAVSKRIIDTDWNDRFENRIPEWHHVVNQIDLMLVHHFDNQAKSVKLKILEFVMRMNDIEDLPFEPETVLTHDEMTILVDYQKHDVIATHKFYLESINALEFRAILSQKYDRNFMNHNDTKIGKDYFIMELEKAGIPTRSNGKLRQTHREYIDLNTVILPYIKFEHPEFNRVLNEIRSTRITETKGALQLSAVINGFSYDFGLGGIHGSVSGQTVKSCCDFIILDADVKSYYPNITIVNRIYPEHLSDVFCDVYDDVYQQRLSHAKGTPENAVMKLALNGVYGDSNSEYSAFYDPKYTMSVTINGQLMLCMLAEQLIKIPKLTVISINTDGICCKVPKIHTEQYYKVCDWWSEYTGLTLEYDYYKLMAIRDVNNFIGLQYEEAEIDADIKKP